MSQHSQTDAQRAIPSYAVPPPFSPPLMPQHRPFDPVKPDVMEIENAYETPQRAASVISGISAEDMEAAETLNSLHKDIHSPKLRQAPPTHITSTTSYNDQQPEPLLSLFTSQYPLAASVLNGSLSIYKTAQSYTPGGEWTERNVGLPLARTTARISGVESGLRWALQPKRESRDTPITPDVEKGYIEILSDGTVRRSSEMSETLPAYTDGDRSPPYSEHSVMLSREQQPPSGWGQQVLITTSGLGVAMSEESIRSLKYCLSWLRWANTRLGGAIQTLKDLLQQWEKDPSSQNTDSDSRAKQAELTAHIAKLKKEVLDTLKKVVNVVSTYAGGALPANARSLVHSHLVSLPQRFSIASRRASNEENADEAANNANRVLVLAQEGLDMMNQVSRVVNDTLVSAEDWCEKLGRRRTNQLDQQQQQQPTLQSSEKYEERERSVTVGRERIYDSDTKMEM